VDVREIDLRTSLLGLPLSWPVVIAPMGGLILFHPEGDREMARGAAQGDTLQFLSGAAGWSVEDLATASPGPKMFQLYHHGDRQLDHTQGSIDALPPIVDTVAGRAAIVGDGGFTRGTAVLKGLALGATVVAVGRTVLWGLAADGAAGVACALDILRRELRTTMALAGQTSVKNLDRDLVFRVDCRGAQERRANGSDYGRRSATGIREPWAARGATDPSGPTVVTDR
jgi:isopentenyl diphosphate isomerase/L-lactate dehydrogenase-like FMN-dependent dehydrogenase